MESDDEDWSRPLDDQQPGQSLEKDTGAISHGKETESAHKRVVIHIDIDCFYAQVEMIQHPELRHKPLGIQQKYIIVTCNYPARERGLTKLMTVKDAKEKCPDLVLVSGEDLTNYRHMSYKISNYLQKYCPLVERLGFDENFLDVTDLVNERLRKEAKHYDVKGHMFSGVQTSDKCRCGCDRRLAMGSHIAAEIREGLTEDLGITSCAGISYNKLLSKLVAGTHKPNQQTTLFPDQVHMLLGQLSSVRNIPGIGHSSAKRLKELGIVSVSDLQRAGSAVLEEEFGPTVAETMKKLCVGVDDTPVVAFGLPQTLSDEDSFRKCSSVDDAESKVRELIGSLLRRLLEDGRIPHTLRVTIRRFSETNRYSNRESRQCNILPSVFSRFCKDNILAAKNQLQTLAMGLFSKMVDSKRPFHLTLINIGFAKLEAKSTTTIASFFSPKGKTPNHEKVVCEMKEAGFSKTNRSVCKAEDIHVADDTATENTASETGGSTDEKKALEEAVVTNRLNVVASSNDKNGVLHVSHTGTKEGSFFARKKSGLAKWLVQSPTGSKTCAKNIESTVRAKDHTKTANMGCVNPDVSAKCHIADASNTLFSDYESDDMDGRVVGKKRAWTEQAAQSDDPEPNCSKKLVLDSGSNRELNFANSSSSSGLQRKPLPAGVDKGVFLQLPESIQDEILQSSRQGQTDCSSNKMSNGEPNTSVFPENTCRARFSSPRPTEQGTGGDMDSVIELKREEFMCECSDTGLSVTYDHSCDSAKCRLANDSRDIPPNVDREVFVTLPPGIQQELLQEWKQAKGKVSQMKTTVDQGKKKYSSSKSPSLSQMATTSNTMHVTETNSFQAKPFCRAPKPSSKNNILSYFSKM